MSKTTKNQYLVFSNNLLKTALNQATVILISCMLDLKVKNVSYGAIHILKI